MRRTLAICSCLVAITMAAYWQAWGPPLCKLAGHPLPDKVVAEAFGYSWTLPTKPLEFVYFDDPGYVIDNLHVHKGLCWENVQWAFETGEQSNWHPLTWLSHMLDIELFGFRTVGKPDSIGPHFVNLLLHTSNTLLLFLLLYWMTGGAWRSAIVAGLFAVHPMHVESVAWVAERKDLLSTLIGLLTLLSYVWYVKRLKANSDLPPEKRFLIGAAWYLPVFLLYGLGLMAKPMLVTLPCVMLLLDYWPLGRLTLRSVMRQPARKTLEMSRAAQAKRKMGRQVRHEEEITESRILRWEAAFWLVMEKAPLLLLTVASSVRTCYFQEKGGSMASVTSLPLNLRLNNVLTAYVRYIAGMFWPRNLCTFYPYDITPNQILMYGAAWLLLLVTILALVGAYFGRRYLVVGWFWYIGIMVPVIGFVQVGDQSMADRYSYFTFTGLFIMVVWGAYDLLGRWQASRVALGVVAAAALAACVGLTVKQVCFWQNRVDILERGLSIWPDNPAFENNLGVIAWEDSEHLRATAPEKVDEARAFRQKAIEHWRTAVKIRDRFSDALNNLGCALRFREKETTDEQYHQQLLEAVKQFQLAIAFKETHADARSNLALTYWELKKPQEAIDEFQRALEVKADHLDARVSLARVLREQKRLDEAVTHLQVVIHLNPRRFDAYAMLGEIRREQKKPQQAAAMFNMAAWLLATSPDDTKRNGRMAVGLASNAMNAAGGQTPELLDTMAAALAEAGNFDQAVKAAEQAANMLAAQSEQATTAAEKQRCAELAAAIRFRMELYKKKQKFRDERPVKSGE